MHLSVIENVDASILKKFLIREQMKVTFRAELFNLFNDAQVWGVNTSFSGDNPEGGSSTGNKAFGRANSYRDVFCGWRCGFSSDT